MQPTPEEIRDAAQLIREGKLVAFPTETVYGLGANALDPEAVGRIYEAKGRPSSSPLIVHVAGLAMARRVAADWPEIAEKLAARFWPGPLTLVLPKNLAIPDIVTAGLPSVAIRMPSHPVALRLIELAGVPVAAPSANRFTGVSPTMAEHVRLGLGDRVQMILNGGPSQVGIESTVVSLTGRTPVILRLGMIAASDLEAATGVSCEQADPVAKGPAESPGLHPRHYAPRTPLYILEPRSAAVPEGRGRILNLPSDPAEYAARIYAELHSADREGWDWIAVEKPPDTPEWAAIRDRLQRAATKL
ncbi:MAG TPA: L-threonylcarbamoyladenylate synthase [Bryobacteraceae bacterium]